MPLYNPATIQEMARDVHAMVEELQATRRSGFFVNEVMMTKLLGDKYGSILPPPAAAAIYKQVTDRFCPFEMDLSDWTVKQMVEAAEGLDPSGMVAVQSMPVRVVRFSQAVDLVKYRLLLPELGFSLL